MSEFWKIVLSFVLLTVVGNFLLQRWQHRTWVRQQQFLGQEKEYIALRELFPELSSAIAVRLYQTNRLFWVVKSQELGTVDERLVSYDSAISQWNEKLGSFYARLTIYAHYSFTKALEDTIHNPFQSIRTQLEAAVRRRRTGENSSAAEAAQFTKRLGMLTAAHRIFSRNLLSAVEDKRRHVYFGRAIEYTIHNISKFSTWELVKALFASDINSYAVIRPPAGVRLPNLPTFKWPRGYTNIAANRAACSIVKSSWFERKILDAARFAPTKPDPKNA